MGSDQSVMATPLPALEQPHDAQDVSEVVFSAINEEDSFLSCDSFVLEPSVKSKSAMNLSAHSNFDEEFCNTVNFAKFQALVADASVPYHARNNSQSRNLYDVVNFYRITCNYQACVSACASFIISYLKYCGNLIPSRPSMLNDKTTAMVKVLAELKKEISEMKIFQGMKDFEKGCIDCRARELLLKNLDLVNVSSKGNLCLVCLAIIPEKDANHHEDSDLHSRIKEALDVEIYPHVCSTCNARFENTSFLKQHAQQHKVNDNLEQPVRHFCCYLCKTSFQSRSDLSNHNILSIQHTCRKELAWESALRLKNGMNIQRNEKLYNDYRLDLQKNTLTVQESESNPLSRFSNCNVSESISSLTSPSLKSFKESTEHRISPAHSENFNSPAQTETTFGSLMNDRKPFDESCNNFGGDQLFSTSPISESTSHVAAPSFNTLSQNIRKVDTVEDGMVGSQCSAESISFQSPSSDLAVSQIACSPNTVNFQEVNRCESPEFDAECGSCGGLFKIYNNDLKLSMDIHIQSDAQHCLAATVATSQNFIEEKSSNAPPCSPTVAVGGSSGFVQKVERPEKLKEDIVESLFSSVVLPKENGLDIFILRETKCFKLLDSALRCKICSVNVPLGAACILAHVWGRNHFSSLLASNSDRSFWKHKSRMLSYVEQHLLNMGTLGNLSGACLQNILCCIRNTKESVTKHFPPHYECVTCKVTVQFENKAQHEAGRTHCQNLKTLEQKVKLPSQQYYCSLCDRTMHPKDRDKHLKGAGHLSMKQKI